MRVLLCTDGSPGADAATGWLERFTPAEPSLLHVVAIAPSSPVSLSASSARRAFDGLMLDRSRATCEAARARLGSGWPDLSVRLMDGDAREQVLRAAEEWRPELVVLGGASIGDDSAAFLGRAAIQTARYLECSVLFVNRAPASMQQIVVGMDGSASAREAVRLLSLFRFDPIPRVLALGVVSSSWRRAVEGGQIPPAVRAALAEMEARQAADARAMLERMTASLVGRAHVETATPIGSPAEEILRAARERAADLIVIGHQGVERVRRLPLGSVGERLLAAATCPILIGRK